MHGRQRRLTEKTPEEIQLEQVKAAKLKKAGLTVLEKMNAKDYSPEVFQMTAVVAKLNPDFYSIWNYRKDYISLQLENEGLEEESKKKLLKNECTLTEDIIREKDQKCYGVWHHRRWLFDKDSSLLEEREWKLCESLLKLDQRNFHCWNHWLLICKKVNQPLETQLAFTWDRIQENSSNYSAWHFRGELIKQLIESKYAQDEKKCISLLKSELEVNLNALYTECDDQSSWYYMRSLLTIARELEKEHIISTEEVNEMIQSRIENIMELIELEPDCLYASKFLEEIKQMYICLLIKQTNQN